MQWSDVQNQAAEKTIKTQINQTKMDFFNIDNSDRRDPRQIARMRF